MQRILLGSRLSGESFKFIRHLSMIGLPAASYSVKMEQAFLPGKIAAWLRPKRALTVGVLMILAGVIRAQTLADLGATAPTPGANDIAQLSIAGNQTFPDNLNYYTDNQTGHGAGEPGQTFTTGSSPGYMLTSVSLRTAGLGDDSGTGTLQPYYLHIYSVSGGNVTLLQTYTSANVTFNDGDWLQWSGLSMPLSANTTYAYSFGKASNSISGWEALAVATNNPYAGGQIGLFPPAGGVITFGSSQGFDAVFDLGLAPANLPGINQLTMSPTNNVFAGTLVTFTASVSGAPPLYFQWQFNNGGGYANIPGVNTNTLVLIAAVTNTGSYKLVVTNSYGAVTSAPVALSVTLDTNPPVVLRGFNIGTTNVELDFSKIVEAASATNLANYVFTDGLAITAASLTANNMSVLLTTAPLVYGSNYTLVINGITDQAIPPNTIAVNTLVGFTASPRGRILLDSGWRFHLNEVDGSSTTTPAGTPLTQWVWIADDNAPTDASIMAAPGLDTSTWTNGTVGTDVFNGRVGYAWFRTSITNLASAVRPLSLYFLSVDDNATVYLNGTLIGQHDGWSEPFDISLDPAWITNGVNVLAVAVQNTAGAGGIYGGVYLQSGPSVQPQGILVTQWLWLADDNAPNDAATMTATNLNTSAWQTATIGQDVFNGHVGYAWFRTTLDALASSGRPLTLHFVSVDDNASIYLNGTLLGTHTSGSQAFDISPLDYAWVNGGPNVLAVAVQNTSGPGGMAGPVSLQSGADVEPPGNPVTQWIWIADDNATNDAPTMTATNLNTSSWSTASIGQNVFNDRVGSAWFRANLTNPGSTNPPLALHFLGVDDNATVYLNGSIVGQHIGGSQPFDVTSLAAWVSSGTNVLAVAVQNTSGPGGILKPVLLQPSSATQGGPAATIYNDSGWRTVQLPHDYIIEGTFTNTADPSHGSLPQTTAWYRHTFTIPASAQGQSIWIDFDGVYHDSEVWLNGNYLGNWWSGYAGFRYDVSQYAIAGGTNVLAVHVDPTSDEGWWYEGGGIYRHVWLNIANPLHVAPWGTFVASTVTDPDTNGNAAAVLTITTTITNAAAADQSCILVSQVAGPDGISPGTATTSVLVPAGTATNVVQTLPVANARLWSIDTPQLYVMHTAIQVNSQTIDNSDTTFGIRSLRYDVNNGFFLNGQPVKLNGTCNHQDFAGVGIGMPDNLLYWRIQKLKEMGANAYRCSHNPPTEALLDACDRLGMVVMDETRHLGDATGAKSDASTPYSDLSELNSMILRDRNHPSIIMWSMCNEEFAVQGTQHGADIFYAMKQRVLQFDTTRPITCAMNGGWGTGISLVEDLQGCNYNPGGYDSFHASFPAEPMFGSESASALADRGTYTNDGVAYVSAYTTTPETSWQPVATRPFVAGAFVWTGFDYKGEPTPYGWPCINSKFGAMDMCGLPKDMYYYYQAWWGNKPLVYIFPHWNWSTGQTITVWCYGNTPTVELFLNGVSRGAQTMPAYGHVAWSVPYAPGTLLVKGYDANNAVIATNQVVTTGAPASLRLTTDRTTLTADGEDVTVVYASVLDSQGLVVPTASNLVTFAVSGAGYVAGVGNGDAACHEPDRASQRNAFNGWCMALVGANNFNGAVTLTATSPGLAPAVMNLQSLALTSPPATPTGLSAVAGNAQVKLNWTISFGATSYNVKRANVSGGPYSTIANYTTVGFTDTAVANGVNYYYVVSAVNSNGESTNSAEASAIPVAPVSPASPAGLAALPDDGQVSLNWNAVTGTASYNVKRSTVSGGPYTNVLNTTVNYTTDTGLTNGTTYYYVVSAVAAGIETPNSSQVSATPFSMSFLVGTITGTTGSWGNVGNTREKAMDGNLNTFFDAPDPGSNDWVGLDLGTNVAKVITKICYCPRSGFSSRMVGGMFQGANASDFSDAVTLFTFTSQPTEGAMLSLLITNLNPFRYVRYLSPVGGYGNVAEVAFYSPGPHISQMSGTVLGTAGASTNTSANVFDDDITTFFDSATANGNWVGLDLGNTNVITNVRYCPRSGYDSLMLNGIFQGANQPDFSDAVNLLTITNTPPDATLTAQPISNTNGFRFVRYLSPANSYGDIAEAQFFSSTPGSSNTITLPSVPTGLTTTPGYEQVGLSWTASSGDSSYNIKRATVSGGPYINIANVLATVYMDSGLPYGTYYYVVSAVNAAGESANSTEAVAVLTCSTPGTPTGLAATAENGQLILVWSPATGVLGYNVLRSTNSGGPWTLLAANVAGTSWTDTTVTNRAACYYTVEAFNSCGPSASSGSVSASLAGLNVTPSLAPVPNQVILAGRTLLITNRAADLDVPPQILTYSLLAPPGGASVNPGSGVLSWRPAMVQSGTTNLMSVVVTDNGEPNLSATQNFTVTVLAPVRPFFGQPTFTNGVFQSSILGDFGPDYSVLGSSNLMNWELILTTNSPSLPLIFMDSGATNRPQRFYRAQLGP